MSNPIKNQNDHANSSSIHHKQRTDVHAIRCINEFEQSLLKPDQRSCTDIFCIIVGVTFAVLITIVSFAIYNPVHYQKANFPTDSNGNLCGIDYPGYPYVYFTEQSQIKQRLCVKKCPAPEDTKLSCMKTSTRGCNFNSMIGFRVENYPTFVQIDRNGHFCLPEDEDARNLVLSMSRLDQRNIFFNSNDTLFISVIVALFLALIYLFCVQFFPKPVNNYILYAGVVILLILAICTFAYPSITTKPKIVIGLIMLGFLLVVALTIYLFKQAVRSNEVFLHYATIFARQNWVVLIFTMIIFIIMFVVFAIMMVLQLNSIWTSSDLSFSPQSSLYWQYAPGFASHFMTFLWIIQAIWGLNFIKQSFNFIVSGYAALWYYQKSNEHKLYPYKLYLTKHIGSVIACAFMSAFFNVFDTIFDIVRGLKIHQTNIVFNRISIFLDLVRSESLAHIVFSGNSYCNSARYCEYLQTNSQVLQNSQSASRAYRISAYALLGGLVAFLSFFVDGRISIYGMGYILFLSYFLVNFFVQLHADAGDAIMILFLENSQFLFRQDKHNYLNSLFDSTRQYKQFQDLNGRSKQIQDQLRRNGMYNQQKKVKSQKQKKQSEIKNKKPIDG